MEDLEALGILLREKRPEPARVQLYRLSEAGMGLWPVIRALCQWGAGMPGHDPRLFISPAALMLSMRAMCARGRAGVQDVAILAAGQAFVDLFALRPDGH